MDIAKDKLLTIRVLSMFWLLQEPLKDQVFNVKYFCNNAYDIRSSFNAGDAAKILSIGRYWVATDGNPLPRLESWQNMHNLPYSQGISEDVYGALFKSVGCDEGGIQQYFSHRAARLDKNPVIALDSTTLST